MDRLNGKRAGAALALAAGAAVLWRWRAVLMQIAMVFVLAAGFTLLLSPLCTALEKRGVRPALASALSLGALVLTLLLAVAAFVPYLVTHSAALVSRITPTLSALLEQGSSLMSRFGLHLDSAGDVTRLLGSALSGATAWLARGGMAFAAQAGRAAFALVLAYYLLCERRAIVNHLLLFLPLAWRTPFLQAMRGCGNAVLGYLSGVAKTSLFVGGATFLGLALLGVRDALLLALFMGLFEVLPYIGPVLASIPILLSTLPQGLYPSLLALALVIAVQQVEGSFVSPYFTASSTSIHPLSALVSVFVLGSLFGLWGVLLAVPLVVTARSLLWSLGSAANPKTGR